MWLHELWKVLQDGVGWRTVKTEERLDKSSKTINRADELLGVFTEEIQLYDERVTKMERRHRVYNHR